MGIQELSEIALSPPFAVALVEDFHDVLALLKEIKAWKTCKSFHLLQYDLFCIMSMPRQPWWGQSRSGFYNLLVSAGLYGTLSFLVEGTYVHTYAILNLNEEALLSSGCREGSPKWLWRSLPSPPLPYESPSTSWPSSSPLGSSWRSLPRRLRGSEHRVD